MYFVFKDAIVWDRFHFVVQVYGVFSHEIKKWTRCYGDDCVNFLFLFASISAEMELRSQPGDSINPTLGYMQLNPLYSDKTFVSFKFNLWIQFAAMITCPHDIRWPFIIRREYIQSNSVSMIDSSSFQGI